MVYAVPQAAEKIETIYYTLKRALVIGVGGQDGAYIADLLLQQGYEVFGTSRDADAASFRNFDILGIRNRVQLHSLNLIDFRSTLQALKKIKPDEIYNLSGQSSVGLSFEQPVETLESISIGTLNLLESIRFMDAPVKMYNAGSSECFGDIGNTPATEDTPFRPRSPYAVAKAAAFWKVANYREAYQLYACTGILFNHESPLRPPRFVTRKIISTAVRIQQGSKEKLRLGNIDIERDWGWAPEYVNAMWRMLQQEQPGDYVICTGVTHSLKYFIEYTFQQLGLNYEDHLEIDSQLFRPNELKIGRGNPEKAARILGWKAAVSLEGVIENMIAFELNKQ